VAEVRVAVLVEGESDREAVLALADKREVRLAERGVDVVAMGGVTNIARHVAELGPTHRLTGLYDAAEERFVRGGLERAGLLTARGPDGLAALGFHSCDRDLEDELIRALGVTAVLAVVEAQGDLAHLRGLQQQPAQRHRRPEDQLHRFFGSGSGRKIRYGRLLVEALADDSVPAPLERVLADALA
jgi:hypothetical protein